MEKKYDPSNKKKQAKVLKKPDVNVITSQTSLGEESSDEENDIIIDPIPKEIIARKNMPRTSISAESYGIWNKKKEFVARVIPKTPEQAKRYLKLS